MLTGQVAPARTQTTERIVSDRHTGLAISGFDPVAYFVQGAALAGNGEHEFRHGGVVWQFRNSGNRDAFSKSPAIFMPAYGGYDPVALADGVVLAGNPTFWAISGRRLYLFHSAPALNRFLAEPGMAIAAAEAQWPKIRERLVP